MSDKSSGSMVWTSCSGSAVGPVAALCAVLFSSHDMWEFGNFSFNRWFVRIGGMRWIVVELLLNFLVCLEINDV